MNTIKVSRIKTWSLSWDRAGKPGKRNGNRFFSEARAQEVFEQKKAAGLNPSTISVKDMDWICM